MVENHLVFKGLIQQERGKGEDSHLTNCLEASLTDNKPDFYVYLKQPEQVQQQPVWPSASVGWDLFCTIRDSVESEMRSSFGIG